MSTQLSDQTTAIELQELRRLREKHGVDANKPIQSELEELYKARQTPTINPALDYYKYQLSEMLRMEEAKAAAPPPKAPEVPGKLHGMPIETLIPGGPAQPKGEEFSIFTPLINVGEIEKARIESERKVGYRTMIGPGAYAGIRLPPSSPTEAGIRVGVANLISSLSSPIGIAAGFTPLIPAIGALSPALKLAIEGGFGLGMAYGFVRNSKDAFDAYRRGDNEEFGRAATEAIGDGIFTFLVSKGAINEARTWYRALRSAWARTPRKPGPITEVGPRETQPPPTIEPEILEGPPEVAIARAKTKIAEMERIESQHQAKLAAEKLAKAKERAAAKPPVAEPVWPPRTEAERATAEAKFKAAVPKKEELIAEAKKVVPGKPLEPTKPELLQTEIPKVMEKAEVPVVEPAKVAEPSPPSPVEKPTLAEPTKLMVTQADISAMEKHYGKDFLDLTDEQIWAFKTGKPIEKPTEVKEPIPEVSIEDEMEKFYGKPLEQLTEKEINDYLDKYEKLIDEIDEVPVVPERVTSIDLQSGTPDIPEVVGEESIFRTEKAATKQLAKQYTKDATIATSVDEALRRDPVNQKDIAKTVWKLSNDTNRWLEGEDVDIATTRDFLSEIAARADEFRDDFRDSSGAFDSVGFNDWKELVSDAAKWARKADRVKIKPTGKPSTKLYSGLDPFEVAKEVSKWWSKLKDVAREKLPTTAPAEQVINTLRKNVTKDEWEASGLEQTLEPGTKVRKEEVLKQIDERLPKFEDVLLEKGSGTGYTIVPSNRINPELGQPYIDVLKDGRLFLSFDSYDSAEGAIEKLRKIDSTKFSTYVEPGGTDYKELFVTAPESAISKQTKVRSIPPQPEGYQGELYYDEAYHRAMTKDIWRDGHPDYSDIENPIVRLRFNTRTDAEGKKVLFIEELQAPQPGEFEKMPTEFQKRWREIGMKRAFKYAIDNGFDKVAWTTGEMQASRYLLDTVVERIDWARRGGNFPGQFHGGKEYFLVNVTTKEGGIKDYYPSPEELPQLVGNEIANKIISSNKDLGIIEGLDLKIKNEGLRKLYDTDLVNVARKIGGKVEVIDLDFTNRAELSKFAPDIRFHNKVPSADLSAFKKGWVPTLYSGLDPVEAAKALKELIASGRRGADAVLASEKAKKFYAKQALRDLRETFNKDWLHQSGNIRRKLETYGTEGAKIIRAMALKSGGHPHSTNMRNQANKEIYDGVTRDERRLLHGLIFHQRLIEIYKTPSGRRFQYFKEHPISESIAFIEGIESKEVNKIQDLTPERAAELKRAADIHFEWIRKAVKDAYEEGLIGKDEMNELVSHNYQRIQQADPTLESVFDKQRETMLGGKKINVHDSGIEVLAAAKDIVITPALKKEMSKFYGKPYEKLTNKEIKKYLEEFHKTTVFEANSDLLMLETFNRLYGRIYKNKANRALQDLARKDPENPFARVREPEVEQLNKQPKTRGKLRDSIEIKRLGKGISDYELMQRIREMFKVSDIKKLNNEQLAKFDSSLGEMSYGYVKDTGAKIPKGWRPHFFFENGAEKTIYLEPSFSDEWLVASPEMTGKLARLARFASASTPVRLFATGISPIFALRNLPKDVNHAWFASRVYEDGKWKSVYSTVAPKFLWQLGGDYRATFRDALKRRGAYNDMIEDGAGTEYLTLQGRPFRRGLHLDNSLDKTINFLGYLNETSEIATRLAIRNRVIRNKAKELGITFEEASRNKEIREEASFTALDQMNFGEGGSVSKALDNIIPYLNARIVGTRSFFRAFRPKSGTATQSWLKLAQFAGLIAGLYLLNRFRTPETSEALKGDPRAEGNLVIPLGDSLSFRDRFGETRYPFLVIPIDQSQRFLKALFEVSIAGAMGDRVEVTRLLKALRDSSPVDISTLPPSFAAIMGYSNNIDFWLSEDIWRATDKVYGLQLPKILTGKEVGGSEEEYIPGRTSELAIAAGAVTGMSPERLQYAMKQLITNDNFYAQVLGGMYDEMFSTLPKSQREETLAEALSKVPVIKSFFKITNPRTKYGEQINEGKDAAELRNFTENRGLDTEANNYLYDKSGTLKRVIDYIDRDPNTKELRGKADVERLKDRFAFHEDTKELSSRSFWLMLRGISDPAGRAKTYVDILNSTSEKDRKRILSEEADVIAIERRKRSNFAIFTEEFRREVIRLTQQFPVK